MHASDGLQRAVHLATLQGRERSRLDAPCQDALNVSMRRAWTSSSGSSISSIFSLKARTAASSSAAPFKRSPTNLNAEGLLEPCDVSQRHLGHRSGATHSTAVSSRVMTIGSNALAKSSNDTMPSPSLPNSVDVSCTSGSFLSIAFSAIFVTS